MQLGCSIFLLKIRERFPELQDHVKNGVWRRLGQDKDKNLLVQEIPAKIFATK